MVYDIRDLCGYRFQGMSLENARGERLAANQAEAAAAWFQLRLMDDEKQRGK